MAGASEPHFAPMLASTISNAQCRCYDDFRLVLLIVIHNLDNLGELSMNFKRSALKMYSLAGSHFNLKMANIARSAETIYPRTNKRVLLENTKSGDYLVLSGD